MSSVGFADDLVRDYLLYRGFMGSLKQFDNDIKVDKDKGFRPDRVVDHLFSCIASMDLTALREAWSHLDHRIFCRLEHSFLSAANKLEVALLRMYVVTCITNNRADKVNEFFDRMTLELQNVPEWKDWFALPFLKSPEENPQFQVFFTRQWQETMLMSLHNFLSVVFQTMTMPTLLSYEDELLHLAALQEENEYFKQKLLLHGISDSDKADIKDFSPHSELMDDFYVIAQEAPSAENQSRSLRTLIRNIGSGLPTSPLLGRRPNGSRRHTVDDSSAGKPTSAVKPKPRTTNQPSNIVPPTCASGSTTAVIARVRPQMEIDVVARARVAQQTTHREEPRAMPITADRRNTNLAIDGRATPSTAAVEHRSTLLLLSQEEYSEHHSCITHCKFNCSGTVVASSDMEGVIKIWSPIPSPQTIASVMSRSSILSLEWASKREKLLLHGNASGQIRLYDIKDKRTIGEFGVEETGPLKDQRIMCIACNPSDTHFVCSTAPPPLPVTRTAFRTDSANSVLQGKLLLWDLRTQQLERNIPMDLNPSIWNCCAFNHNGQLLISGNADGKVALFDMRTGNFITTWNAHVGETYSVQFSADETSCYTMGSDGKFVQWSINKTGQKLADIAVHSGATGPYVISGPHPSAPKHHPLGKMFAFDTNGGHFLTCGSTGGIIYKLSESAIPTLSLGGHRCPVVTVDWSTTVDCGTCLTGSLDGKIQVSTLLAQ